MPRKRSDREPFVTVSKRIYADARVRNLSNPPGAWGLWHFLLIGAESYGPPGLYALDARLLALLLRWPEPETRKALDELEMCGLVEADHEAGVIVLPRAVHHAWPLSWKNTKHWRKQFDLVPESPLRARWLETLWEHCIQARGWSDVGGFEDLFDDDGTPVRDSVPDTVRDRHTMSSPSSSSSSSPSSSQEQNTVASFAATVPGLMSESERKAQERHAAKAQAVLDWQRGLEAELAEAPDHVADWFSGFLMPEFLAAIEDGYESRNQKFTPTRKAAFCKRMRQYDGLIQSIALEIYVDRGNGEGWEYVCGIAKRLRQDERSGKDPLRAQERHRNQPRYKLNGVYARWCASRRGQEVNHG